jgi:RNA polymerase sigma-70 factor (ECF subfamily)
MKPTLPEASTRACERAVVPSDEELLLGYRQTGDPELFAQLVRRYEGELFSYLRRYLGDAEMAEDAFQRCFMQVHLKCRQFEAGRAVRPWLYTIATHQAIDAQRRRRRQRTVSLDRLGAEEGEGSGKLADLLLSREPAPAARLGSAEQAEWLHEALARLGQPLRDVVQLVYFQGLKYREAAEVLGIPVGTVKSRMHAAVAALTELWHKSHASSTV